MKNFMTNCNACIMSYIYWYFYGFHTVPVVIDIFSWNAVPLNICTNVEIDLTF